MATHASRNTITGLEFEKQITFCREDGINISKSKLRGFLKDRGLDNPLQYLSWMFQPDEAYYIPATNEVIIYEKKSQQVAGSADEKLATCEWKLQEYRDCFAAVGINTVSYIFVFNDWFKQPRYEKLLNYIRSKDGCDYIFAN